MEGGQEEGETGDVLVGNIVSQGRMIPCKGEVVTTEI